MNRMFLALIASAAILPVAAQAQVGPSFRTKGECSKAIAWANWDARKGLPNPLGVLSPNARCEKIAGLWYVIDEFASKI